MQLNWLSLYTNGRCLANVRHTKTTNIEYIKMDWSCSLFLCVKIDFPTSVLPYFPLITSDLRDKYTSPNAAYEDIHLLYFWTTADEASSTRFDIMLLEQNREVVL
jgi:hypothetical protein